MITETAFNSAPIMLQPPTKTSSSMLMTLEQDILSNMFYHTSSTYYQDEDVEDDAMMSVPQHLDSEQINYEFPPKSHLKALSYLDQLEEEYSFFDETSFTSLSNDSSSFASSSLSGYFEDEDIYERSSATTPPPSHSFFSSLIDGKDNDLDLTRISHHMLMNQHHQQQEQYQNNNDYHEMLQQDQSSTLLQRQQVNPNNNSNNVYLVDDNKLSPLQLPAQAQTQLIHHQREQSCDSSTTITKDAIVAPQSFLSMPSVSLYKSNHVDPSPSVRAFTASRTNSIEGLDLPIIISETEPILELDNGDDDQDRNSMTSDYLYPQQQTVLIKISKHNTNKHGNDNNTNKQPYRRPTSLTYLASDEGYEDDDRDEKLGSGCEIESASVFLPLEDDDEHVSHVHQHQSHALPTGFYAAPSNGNDTMTQAMWTSFLQQQEQWTARIQHLEQQLDEERAMRQAFEKTMEDMTILMDQQQKVLYDRLEQEISMREAYEHKMQQTVAHVQPLEIQLEKEVDARQQLEQTMGHVLEQLERLQTQHDQHVNDDTAQRKRMQKKLDQALNDIENGQMVAASTKINNMTNRPATTTSSSSNTLSKQPARSSTASGITANTKSSHSRTTTSTNKSGTSSIVRTSTTTTTTTPQLRSRPSKLVNKRSTITPSSSPIVTKSGLESQQQKQTSTSSSRRLVFHR